MTSRTPKLMNRRRVLFMGASLAGWALTPGGPVSLADETPLVAHWSGQALGAHAQIRLVGLATDDARHVFNAIETEIARLEMLFSLYRSDSALVRLNSSGILRDPPPEFVELMAIIRSVHRQTDGLFDPTVQPLFALYAEHHANGGTGAPSPALLRSTLARTGFDRVETDNGAIRYRVPGMAMTLNGIAQGFVTDKIAALLRRQGFANVLVDIGEISALGAGMDGRGWRVGLRKDPMSGAIAERIVIADKAIATSMMLGTTFDNGGTAGHILHPKKGLVSRFNARASVVDASAARADGLSTAAILMTRAETDRLKAEGVEIHL